MSLQTVTVGLHLKEGRKAQWQAMAMSLTTNKACVVTPQPSIIESFEMSALVGHPSTSKVAAIDHFWKYPDRITGVRRYLNETFHQAPDCLVAHLRVLEPLHDFVEARVVLVDYAAQIP